MTHDDMMKEFDALIAQADGSAESISVKQDPALARTLEMMKETYEDAYFSGFGENL